MSEHFNEKQLEYITDTTCKYGHLMGWNTENNCYKCSDCGKLIPCGEKPALITEVK